MIMRSKKPSKTTARPGGTPATLRYYKWRSPGQFKGGDETFCPKHDILRLRPGGKFYNAAEDQYWHRLKSKTSRHHATCDVCAGRTTIGRSKRI